MTITKKKIIAMLLLLSKEIQCNGGIREELGSLARSFTSPLFIIGFASTWENEISDFKV